MIKEEKVIKAIEQKLILDKVYTDIQKLRGCSCSCSDGIIDDVEDILDKYKAEVLKQESCEIGKFIKDLPSVNPVRKKGHWIMTNNYLTAAYETIDYVKCSCCGEESLEEGDYCPNCGAEMES